MLLRDSREGKYSLVLCLLYCVSYTVSLILCLPDHRQLASFISTCSVTAALSQLTQQHAAALRSNHVRDALTQVAKLKQSPSAADEACIRQLAGLATAMLPACNCQGLTLVAQAVKRTRHKDPAFTQELVVLGIRCFAQHPCMCAHPHLELLCARLHAELKRTSCVPAFALRAAFCLGTRV